MGLFKKTIANKTQFQSGEFVTPLSDNKIKIGDEITVLQNQVLVFMVREKIADCLGTGVHRLNPQTMPITFELLKKYYSVDVKNLPKYICLEGYYVSLNETQLKNILSEIIVLKIKNKYVRFKANLNVTVQVSDSAMVVKSLSSYGKINSQIAKETVGDFVARLFPRPFETEGNLNVQLKGQDKEFISRICAKINASTVNAGFNVVDIQINSLNIPEKYKEHAMLSLAETTTLDKEINEFIKEESASVVLGKVGTDCLTDKVLEVDVISGEGAKTQTEILNLTTGEDAQQEVIFAKEDIPNLTSIQQLFGSEACEAGSENNFGETNTHETGASGASAETAQHGQRAEVPAFCVRCGAKLREGDFFCGRCGNKINPF